MQLRKGFTLIEFVVVISILSLLTVATATAVGVQIVNAQNNERGIEFTEFVTSVRALAENDSGFSSFATAAPLESELAKKLTVANATFAVDPTGDMEVVVTNHYSRYGVSVNITSNIANIIIKDYGKNGITNLVSSNNGLDLDDELAVVQDNLVTNETKVGCYAKLISGFEALGIDNSLLGYNAFVFGGSTTSGTNSRLAGIQIISDGLQIGINPSFNPTQSSYTATVSPNVTSVTIVPTAENSNETIKVKSASNSTIVLSGQGCAVALNSGSNAYDVICTSADGISSTDYQVVISQIAGAVLDSISATYGTNTIPLAWDSLGTTGTASVGYDVSEVYLTPITNMGAAQITMRGLITSSGTQQSIMLTEGINTIPITVSYCGDITTYTLTITRASSPYLTSVTGVTLSTALATETLNYMGTASTGTINFIPFTENTGTVSAINVVFGSTNKTVTSGTGVPLRLATGKNTVTVKVTSTSGIDSRTYVFTISR